LTVASTNEAGTHEAPAFSQRATKVPPESANWSRETDEPAQKGAGHFLMGAIDDAGEK
jgi:hypothetical protein